MRWFVLVVLSLLVPACSGHGAGGGSDAGHATPPPDSGPPVPDAGPPVQVSITIAVNSTRFVTREHFLAAGEMQISGEPFAQSMGRLLTGYSRDYPQPNIYFDVSPLAVGPWIDIPGFSTAVESYEYSKQPMNNVGLESGAGTSLVFGPLIDTDGGGGADATARLTARLQHFSEGSNAFGKWVFPAGTYPVRTDGGLGNQNAGHTGTGAQNPLGWPGIWPTVHPFHDFDPTINASAGLDLNCSISSDDDPGASGAVTCSDYECDYTSLHLPNRSTQVNSTIGPGSDGFAAWKFGLWCMNYLQIMHDTGENAVSFLNDIDAGQLEQVGTPRNQLVGNDGPGTICTVGADAGPSFDCLTGTYLGSSDIEGFQSQTFIEEMDNRAQDWISNLTTTDGVTLTGFPSIMAADSYSYASPLQWFPELISVSESMDADAGFPRPAYALSDAGSDLLDMAGMALGYSTFYALTDQNNPDVGGAQTALVYFDGDPFPADDQIADGEPTLHDRALAMMRVALINMDRLNTDPASGLLVDDVSMSGTTPTRGTTVSTTSVAYTLIALRSALRGCSSQLELYSNNTPDRQVGTTVLDPLPIDYPGDDGGLTFSGRMTQIQKAEGDLLYNDLTDDTGQAWDGWNVQTGAIIDSQDLLDSHTAAIRGLFSMFFATGDNKYRDRAMAVFNRMESVFYDADARLFSQNPAPVSSADYTPLRFALLESALRDVYEVVAARPGGELLQPVLEEQVGRLIKLVLNGWDDRNRDQIVGWPQECESVVNGLPQGGLQMGERALTGELGELNDQPMPGQPKVPTTDREHDCVPDIAAVGLPAALADSVTLTVTRQ